MRRIALCFVVCLSLFGALAQASALHFGSSGRSTVHKKRGHRLKSHKKAGKAKKANKASTKPIATSQTKTTAASTLATSTAVATPATLSSSAAVATPASATSPLFGDRNVESGLDSNPAGWAEAFPFSSASSGTASSIVIWVAKQNQATKLIAGIYSDNNGKPGALLTSGTLSAVKAGAWNTVPVTPAAVQSGHGYWVALLGRGGTLYFSDLGGGSCTSQNSSQTSATSLASTWSTGAKWPSCPVSAYAAGTVASTGSQVGTTGTSSSSSTSADPPPVAVPTILAPVELTAPAVTGPATDGQTLTTSDGTWLDSPASYSYQWQRCDTSGAGCSNILGAAAGSYALTDADIGHTIRSVVTAANSAGSASASSAATSVVASPPAPLSTAAPSVSGSTVQGQTLSTSNGSWSNSPSMMAYEWQDCNSSGTGCTNISGATGSSYALGSGDVGHTIRSVVTASNAGGSNAASSSATAAVTAPPAAPSSTTLPAVSGTTTQGQTLSTSNGSWTGGPTSYSYKWQDCNSSGAGCTNISGATASSYALGSGDVSHTIRSVVTAINSTGSQTATSAQTAVVAASISSPSNTAAPAVSGTGTQGSSLTTSNGTWAGGPTSYTYQWQDCNTSSTGCSNIAGATNSSYTLQGGDVGDTVRSLVTAANSAGSTSAPSAVTATIIADSGGTGTGSGSGGSDSYSCTQHVTTSSFASAFSSAGSGAVLCLAPGSYGSFNGSSKSSMVVITPDVSAGATAPTGNATGGVNGNVTFSGASFSSASNITMDGITFTGDVSMSGNTHDVTLHGSLFHQHLLIDDTSMNNANIDIDYNMFPADKADCVGGPEGRIWPHDTSHSATPDGVVIENNNIGGTTSQCDGVQIGGYGVQLIGNWIHDFHYQNSAHTDGIQDYGGRHEVVNGNFIYNVPDCYVSYDGTDHADVENNICVNDGTQNNGASPNDLDILGDSGSTIKHNTVVAYKDSYNNAGGCITLGSKSGSSTGTTVTDNIATCLVTDSGGHSASYTENHNMWVSSGPSGTGDVHGTPTYQGGSCASLSSSQAPFCSDTWSDYLLGSSSSGYAASEAGSAVGAYGLGPVAPGE